MFKTASESQSFISRVASHSTKGRANGRVDVLPPQAREKEIVYDEALRQFKAIESQITSVQSELLSAVGTRRNQLLADLQSLRTLAGQRRLVSRAKAEEAYAVCFYVIAEMRLHKDLFRQVDEEVIRIMGRTRHGELKKKHNERRDRLRSEMSQPVNNQTK